MQLHACILLKIQHYQLGDGFKVGGKVLWVSGLYGYLPRPKPDCFRSKISPVPGEPCVTSVLPCSSALSESSKVVFLELGLFAK